MHLTNILFLIVLVAIATAKPTPEEKEHYDLNDSEKLFEKYIKDYNKEYKDAEDKKIHYEAFKQSLERINHLNSDPTNTATFGLNALADRTPEEFRRMNGIKLP